MAITTEVVHQHGLNEQEYARILDRLGREPTLTELGIFSVMWSEHCCYKSSKPLLKNFPTTKRNQKLTGQVLVKAGEENAGVVDIGDDWAICFKIESHNHPSAVEPFEGAATGVGGIIRDIVTMGATPIFLTNSLRFGELDNPEVQRLFRGVVKGIANYGNCIGIPNVGGDLYFDASFEGNPLVNALCLGALKHESIRQGSAKGVGNSVLYIGPLTGPDGQGGAAFASRELSEASAEDRPAVQKGDPFMGKLLMEACLEMMAVPGLIVGIQDMGAAGLTCSTSETASRAGTGIEIDLDAVPQREPNMTPYSIMLSESQERMLAIVETGREQELIAIANKWGLPASVIGTVSEGSDLVVKQGKRDTPVHLPIAALVDEAPVYKRPAQKPHYLNEVQAWNPSRLPDLDRKGVHTMLLKLLSSPTIAQKSWVWQQYDHTIKANTAVLPGSDAAVVRLPIDNGREKWLAVANDGNARYCALDPYLGGQAAMVECLRNLACSGARPIAMTDNLNFGNPEKPEVFYQLEEVIRGIADAAKFFDVPCVGGNVSLYNENPKGSIDPSPVIATVGLIKKAKYITRQTISKGNEALILLGNYPKELGGSQYLKVQHQLKTGSPPALNLSTEQQLHHFLLQEIHQGHIRAAHDLSEGGLLVAVAEMLFAEGQTFGFNFSPSIGINYHRWDARLFGEVQSRAIIAVDPDSVVDAIWRAKAAGVPAIFLGSANDKPRFKMPWGNSDVYITWDINELRSAWESAIASIMDSPKHN